MLYLRVNQRAHEPMDSGNHREIQWPGYIWRAGGLIVALSIVAAGIYTGQTRVSVMGSVLSTIFGLLLILSLWADSRTVSPDPAGIVDTLHRLSQTQSSDNVIVIDLGRRWPALRISRHLTSGRAHVVDIYNPQLTPSAALGRERRGAAKTHTDPRLTWYDSGMHMLPLPDHSVSAAFLYRVLSEMVQEGDQRALLREVSRVLVPGGRILIAEPADSWSNRLRPGARVLRPAAYWQRLLTEAGFDIQRTQLAGDVAICIRADKPSPFVGQQMQLELDYRNIT
jgi:SAM-dependent methyltransferase